MRAFACFYKPHVIHQTGLRHSQNAVFLGCHKFYLLQQIVRIHSEECKTRLYCIYSFGHAIFMTGNHGARFACLSPAESMVVPYFTTLLHSSPVNAELSGELR